MLSRMKAKQQSQQPSATTTGQMISPGTDSVDGGGLGTLIGRSGVSLDGQSLILPDDFVERNGNGNRDFAKTPSMMVVLGRSDADTSYDEPSILGDDDGYDSSSMYDRGLEALALGEGQPNAPTEHQAALTFPNELFDDDDNNNNNNHHNKHWLMGASPVLKGVIVASTAILVGASVLFLVVGIQHNANDSQQKSGSSSQQSGNGEPTQFTFPSAMVTSTPTMVSFTSPPTKLSSTSPPTKVSFTSPPTKVSFTSPPTKVPSTLAPTKGPSTLPPSPAPSPLQSSAPSRSSTPSLTLSKTPTFVPSNPPSLSNTAFPSQSPTESAAPSDLPSLSPTALSDLPSLSPTRLPVAYVPGKLEVQTNNGLLLSKGLTARIVATSGSPVSLRSGTSTENYHSDPDAGACCDLPNGRWAYLSNSDDDTNGGVGALYFNQDGEVVDYKKLLTGTKKNSGGGKTPWGTWMSAEERTGDNSKGWWEVHPNSNVRAPVPTNLGDGIPRRYDSFAFDDSNENDPKFYYTQDSTNGPLTRFTPNPTAVRDQTIGNEYLMLVEQGYVEEFLVLDVDQSTFSWTTDRSLAEVNARAYYSSAEGIARYGNTLSFVLKKTKRLVQLNLQTKTFEIIPTNDSANFKGEPDMIFAVGNNIWFSEQYDEDSLNAIAGIHVRSPNGKFHTILKAVGYIYDETVGLALSPDKMHFYFSLQRAGIVFDVTRTDGYSFIEPSAEIEYN